MNEFGGREIQLAPGAVLGLRSWSWSPKCSRGPHLVGMTGHHWEPGVNKADCSQNGFHPPASRGCSCGFYAYWDTASRDSSSLDICGIIRGYGLTQLGTRGFRCAKAEIIAVAPAHRIRPLERVMRGKFSSRSLKLLSEVYGVPVFPAITDMLEEMPLTGQHEQV